jgi:hypothetical protein
MQDIKIDKEFKDLLRPLKVDEVTKLEQSIKDGGCRIPLVLWDNGKHKVLIDGHHRYGICTRNKIPIKCDMMTLKDLPDRDAVMNWIDDEQLGRRNFNKNEFDLVLGRRYNRGREKHGEDRKSSGQNDYLKKTAQKLAEEYGVGEATVKRAGKKAAAVEKLKAVDPEIEAKVASGKGPSAKVLNEAAKLVDTNKAGARKVLKDQERRRNEGGGMPLKDIPMPGAGGVSGTKKKVGENTDSENLEIAKMRYRALCKRDKNTFIKWINSDSKNDAY